MLVTLRPISWLLKLLPIVKKNSVNEMNTNIIEVLQSQDLKCHVLDLMQPESHAESLNLSIKCAK